MTIIVVYFTSTLNVILLPKCLDSSVVGKSKTSLTALLSIYEISFIIGAISIIVYSFSILFAFYPHTVIALPVEITHFSPSTFEVILPLAFIKVPIRILILSPTLLTIFNGSFEAFPVLEDIYPFNQYIFFPVSEVNIA